jgi:hypothetical protein
MTRKRSSSATKGVQKTPKALRTESEGNAQTLAKNETICKMFERLLLYESKSGNRWAAIAYKKALNAIERFKKPITCSADVAKLSRVGKASIQKINEFLSTGKIKKLDELQELYGELPTGIVLSGRAAKPAMTAGQSSKGLSRDQLKELEHLKKTYESKRVVELQDILRRNRQNISGTKDALVCRCADGKLLGAIPVCPLCGAGKLRFDRQTGIYRCPGYVDDDQYKLCVYQSAEVRRTPWEE